ncbi:hypothetical protein ACHAW5_006205 [Stephanodiscus triporus]|uniref:Uncharacterized protein n=1 Tax=Stephanodiscus triporus TaxID=2934178 RepID=A0ABD3MU51_9STRA
MISQDLEDSRVHIIAAARTHFTDADQARRSDPFAILGLTQEAYGILINNNNGNGMMHGSESREGWSFWTWQSGDMIMRKRPVRPAASRRGTRR